MLRFVSLLIVRMLIFLSGVGLLVSHAWGWNEYASAELYVVYFQLIEGKPHYFIVSADGSSASESLNWDEGGIAALDCSPDGRTFAFLSGSRHVYVINRGGLVHDRPADALYTTINVANDGTLALFDPTDARLLVNDRMIDLATAERKGNAFDRVDISAQGLVLWMQDFADIQLVSLATGSVLPTVPHGYSGQWITSGQMFIFADQVTDAEGNWINGGQYLLDVATRRVARIGDWTLGSPLSPDNTKVAVAVPITHLNHNTAQVAVFSIFREQERVLLTHDTQTASQPICFLTFRPQMLIS
ncbi:MAG: hypothetical protein GC204_00865 [Chloroflexi bacterium]|nr:hypothetical protein [Chloroflexota bacterium]